MPVRIAYSAGIRLYPAVCYGITLRVPLSEVIRGQTALHDVRRSPFGILIEAALYRKSVQRFRVIRIVGIRPAVFDMLPAFVHPHPLFGTFLDFLLKDRGDFLGQA